MAAAAAGVAAAVSEVVVVEAVVVLVETDTKKLPSKNSNVLNAYQLNNSIDINTKSHNQTNLSSNFKMKYLKKTNPLC